MTLAQLYEQQDRDIEKYKSLRDKAWADLKAEHTQITASFGGRENVPNDIRKRMDKQMEDYREEWSMYTGQRHKDIADQHVKQRSSITGYTPPVNTEEPEISRAERDTGKMDNKQDQMQEKINQSRPAYNLPDQKVEKDKNEYVSAEQLQELQKIIAQQKAIKERSHEKKRGR